MSAMDVNALSAAFAAHTAGSDRFTRRMAIMLANMDGTSPKALVQRCERLALLKRGSWDWFLDNGGITAKHIAEVRTCSSRREA